MKKHFTLALALLLALALALPGFAAGFSVFSDGVCAAGSGHGAVGWPAAGSGFAGGKVAECGCIKLKAGVADPQER